MKKFSVALMREDGTREVRLFDALNKRALQGRLKEEGLTAKGVREEFSIKGSLAFFILFSFFIVPAAAGFDVAYMSTLVLILIGACWVISLLTRNPRKALYPALITLAMVAWTIAISANFSRGMRRMVPEGNTIAAALEDYRHAYGDYPQQLDQLAPRFIGAIPEGPFRYHYFYHPHGPYGLVVGIAPFNVVYDQGLKRWAVHYPD